MASVRCSGGRPMGAGYTARGPCKANWLLHTAPLRSPLQRVYASRMGHEDGQKKKKKNTFSSFEEMVQQREVVLVDFYAQWCGPCQLQAKVLSECSRDMKDVAFVKINTEKYQDIASKFQVSALPTLVLFKNGKPIRRLEGALSVSQLRSWITESLRSL